MKKLFITLLFLLISFISSPAFGAGETRTVTQGGGGTDCVNDGGTCSAGEFNGLSGSGYAGDTFNFSGTFTTKIQISIAGTSSLDVTIDGYAAGACDPLNSTCSSSAYLNDGMSVENAGAYLIIQDFRMTQTDSSEATMHIKSADHVYFRRNLVEESASAMLYAGTDADFIIIEGNKILECGNTYDAVECFNMVDVDNLLIKGNIIADSDGVIGGDSTNISSLHGCSYVLWEYNDMYGGEAGSSMIAPKESWGVNTEHIYRFNKIHDYAGVGINIGAGWINLTNFYVYGNFLFNGGTGYSSYDTGQYHYWWSNIAIDMDNHGFLTWFQADRSTGVHDIFWYNNTVAYSGDAEDHYQRSGFVFAGGSNLTAKNNLFYNNKQSAKSGQYQQITDLTGLTTDYNTLFHSTGTATWYHTGTWRNLDSMQGIGQEAHGKIADPGFTDPDGADNINGTEDDDYTLDGSVINDALAITGIKTVVMSANGSWFHTKTGYDTVNVDLDTGIDPNPAVTDFTAVPPIVGMASRNSDSDGRERGAYVYVANNAPNNAPEFPSVDGWITPPTPYTAGTPEDAITMTLHEASDLDTGDTLTYRVIATSITGGGGQTSTAYDTYANNGTHTDTGLGPNEQYCYYGEVTDDAGSPLTDTTDTVCAFTYANAPGTPTFSVGTTTATINNLTTLFNGNPQTNPDTPYQIYFTNANTDENWKNKIMWSDGQPYAIGNVILSSQLSAGIIIGDGAITLAAGTEYFVQVRARNGDNVLTDPILTSFTTEAVIDTTAPTPNPATWKTEPVAWFDTTKLWMEASDAIDASTIYVQFDFDPASDNCGSHADIGTGGSDRVWVIETSDIVFGAYIHVDAELQTNQYYCYIAQYKDAIPNTGTASTTLGAYTAANVPAAITFTAEGDTSVEILAYDINGNPTATPATLSAVQCTGSVPNDSDVVTKWLQSDNSWGASEEWMSKATIEGLVPAGLDENTTYTLKSKARNGDSVETALGTGGSFTTTYTPPPPSTPGVTGLGLTYEGISN